MNDLVKVKDEITDVINNTPNNLPPTAEDIGLVFPERTGIQEIDDKNYDEYLDTLQQMRPDLFISDDKISEDNNSDVEPKDEPKDEPDFIPFVDGDGNVLIKTETDEIPPYDYIDSDIESDTSPYVSDDETIPYICDSDNETVIYTTPTFSKNRRDEIYRICAKKRALKTLAKKRAKKLQNIKKKNNKKTHILVRTDVPITSNDPMDILANPNVSTILPPQIKKITMITMTLILTLQIPKLFGMMITKI